MEKLALKKITVDEAKGQAALAKQSNNLLRYELDRVKTEMKVREYNEANKTLFEIRELEEEKDAQKPAS
jgi:hypothetical protein